MKYTLFCPSYLLPLPSFLLRTRPAWPTASAPFSLLTILTYINLPKVPLLPAPCSLLPLPCSLLPTPYSLKI
ncbi:hypothetical protein [Moorena producens]|uniref:hypothetical protein n=1 Tax=Moorena producens TaxID=1155739 RepID=UPI0011EA6259|nr:hypothetical protein [Moorena producens]